MTCKHYWIQGRVQGVFYRASTHQTAQALGLKGWVKNLPDGRVEVLACGEDALLAQLEAWLWQGPPMAHVQHIEIQDETSVVTADGFEIHH